jgi:HEAT repeat protein
MLARPSLLRCCQMLASWALAAVLLLFSLVAGCQSSRWPELSGPIDLGHSADSSKSNGTNGSDAKTASGKNTTDAKSKKSAGSLADSFKPLDDDNWVLAVSAPDVADPLERAAESEPTAPRDRWRHHALEDILERPRAEQPDWLLALQGDKQIVRVNAAIALARLGESTPEKTLASAVRAPELKLAVRRAAAEALGEVHTAAAVSTLNELIDQYGRFTGPARSHYIPEIHAELLHALTLQPGGPDNSRVAEALKSPAPTVKREALDALALATPVAQKHSTSDHSASDKTASSHNVSSDPDHGNSELVPPLALDLTSDADAQVRIAALKLLALRKHPQTEDKIHRALSDTEFSVRAEAIELLGQIGGEENQARLKRLAADHGELIRVAAVQALAKMDDRDSVESAAADQSWRVRRTVAASLAAHPDRRSVNLARQLLTDPSVEVQRATIHMTSAWPLEKSGPLLLSVLDSPNYSPRKDAATLLADRWSAAVGFPIDAPQPRRAELVAQLQQQWTAQFGNIDAQALTAGQAKSTEISETELQQVAALLNQLGNPGVSETERTAAVQALCAMGINLPPILDVLQQRGQPLPAKIYRDVLPHCGREFELLTQLADDDPANRRTALTALVKLSGQKTLPAVAMARLSELLSNQSDPILWLSVFKLIEHDPRDPAALLAAAGMSHPSSEVRRRACAYFATYPSTQGSQLLVAALVDDNISVLHAAAQALGNAPPLADPTPLEALLSVSDHSVRLDAAISLARWKLASGQAALQRLAADDDPQIRRKTAQAIGKLETGNLADSSYLPTLMTLLDDQQDVRRAALQSLLSIAGTDNPPDATGARPAAYEGPVAADGDAQSTLSEQAQRWKQWYSRQNPQH